MPLEPTTIGNVPSTTTSGSISTILKTQTGAVVSFALTFVCLVGIIVLAALGVTIPTVLETLAYVTAGVGGGVVKSSNTVG